MGKEDKVIKQLNKLRRKYVVCSYTETDAGIFITEKEGLKYDTIKEAEEMIESLNEECYILIVY